MHSYTFEISETPLSILETQTGGGGTKTNVKNFALAKPQEGNNEGRTLTEKWARQMTVTGSGSTADDGYMLSQDVYGDDLEPGPRQARCPLPLSRLFRPSTI